MQNLSTSRAAEAHQFPDNSLMTTINSTTVMKKLPLQVDIIVKCRKLLNGNSERRWIWICNIPNYLRLNIKRYTWNEATVQQMWKDFFSFVIVIIFSFFDFLKGWETWIKQKQHLRNVHNTAIHGFKFKQAFFFIYRFFIYRYIDSESLFILWMLKENTSHEMLNILPVSNACPWHYLDLPWSFKARSHQKQKLYQRPNQHMILLCLF